MKMNAIYTQITPLYPNYPKGNILIKMHFVRVPITLQVKFSPNICTLKAAVYCVTLYAAVVF